MKSLEHASLRLTIGQAAAASGVSAKSIRHYESLGLLGDVARTESGYRLYADKDVHQLRFIRRCRDLGFGMDEIAQLLNLWHDQSRSSAQVKVIAERHIRELEQRINTLRAMQNSLQHLTHCCHGDQRPECPILEGLAA